MFFLVHLKLHVFFSKQKTSTYLFILRKAFQTENNNCQTRYGVSDLRLASPCLKLTRLGWSQTNVRRFKLELQLCSCEGFGRFWGSDMWQHMSTFSFWVAVWPTHSMRCQVGTCVAFNLCWTMKCVKCLSDLMVWKERQPWHRLVYVDISRRGVVAKKEPAGVRWLEVMWTNTDWEINQHVFLQSTYWKLTCWYQFTFKCWGVCKFLWIWHPLKTTHTHICIYIHRHTYIHTHMRINIQR